MSEISIKLKIADREYPMRVDASEEEPIRRASRELNERIKGYQEKFKIEDRQDLIAMVAFDCWMDGYRQGQARQESEQFVSGKLARWEQLLAQALPD